LQKAEEEAEEPVEQEGATEETVAATDTSADPEAESKEPEELEAVEDDAMVTEAGRILLDLISLTLQVASLESVPAAPPLAAQAPSQQVQVENKDG